MSRQTKPWTFLASLEKFGINLGLERVSFLLEQLGNPHQKFPSLHIAGTNGKGSTAAILASILKEAGYQVGLYTSPHLFDYRERIKINGQDISRQEFTIGLQLVKKINAKPTVFEALTAVAFWYFAKKKVDWAVVEAGMGGRLDATNVITPLVSVITNIELEHTRILGRTLAAIAGEKAGIIKPGVPVVTAEYKAAPLRVIAKKCQQENSLLLKVSRQQPAASSALSGPHQRINAACALAALRLARIKISQRVIAKGLTKVSWPGRCQVVSRKPLIIVDGAHNPAGIKALRVTLEQMTSKKFTVIFGCQKDKDSQKMLSELKRIARAIIVTKSTHQNAAELTGAAPWKHVFARWDQKSPLLITGSLFLVGDALKLLDRYNKS